LAASQDALAAAGTPIAARRSLKRPDWESVDADVRWSEWPDHSIVALGDVDYPPLLAALARPPPLLFVVGRRSVLRDPQLAMVGSRNPTPGGRATARDFARFFARCGLVITSGLALGIDGESHAGALSAEGETIAVLGTGPDIVYPPRHRELAGRIAESGALVSEFPPGTSVRRENFPRRNRIIAGLCVGTLVVEAAPRSGSLLTARHAAESGREVFAIPGSIHNPQSKGCHALIRQGAKLVETGRDVLEELAVQLDAAIENADGDAVPVSTPSEPADPDHSALLNALGFDPVSVDELVGRTQLTAETVSSILLILELEGKISSVAGGRYVRAASPGRS
jgi:DNA processing protein